MADTPEDARARKERELEDLRAQHRQLEEEALARIRQIASENPEHLMRLFATAAAGVPISVLDPAAGPDDPHPFAHYFRSFDGRPPIERQLGQAYCVKYGYIAAHDRADGLVNLSDYVIEKLPGWKSPHFGLHPFEDVRLVSHDAFHDAAQNFGYAIGEAARAVYQGVPLIGIIEGEPKAIIEPDPLYHYLALRWKYYDFSREYAWPSWIHDLYFDREHLEANKLFFWGGEELNDAQVEARRSAFRMRIGLTEPSAPATRAPTRLLGHVQAVRERYYGANFAAGEPDTWPKQADVVAWLLATHQLSKRLAEAVELVACPDEVRTRR
jgi:hypothetical protein